MIERLDEIRVDLIVRREQAQNEGWFGELEGIDLTRLFLDETIADDHRIPELPITRYVPPVVMFRDHGPDSLPRRIPSGVHRVSLALAGSRSSQLTSAEKPIA